MQLSWYAGKGSACWHPRRQAEEVADRASKLQELEVGTLPVSVGVCQDWYKYPDLADTRKPI